MMKDEESSQVIYCSPSYMTSSHAHPQVSTVSFMCVLNLHNNLAQVLLLSSPFY